MSGSGRWHSRRPTVPADQWRCATSALTPNHLSPALLLGAIPRQVLDWFEAKALSPYSISCGAALLYNNIFPKHKERLGKKMSELVSTSCCLREEEAAASPGLRAVWGAGA